MIDMTFLKELEDTCPEDIPVLSVVEGKEF